ncbi:MAG: MATE family efflux transporter [Deltaproteobacteria bacterium]|nr:MAG: MATE family efflux transporter [Deltaproteobacteria bacterium]
MLSRWYGPGGYRDVLRVGLPLIFSMISHTVMQFTDRVFLGNYSMDTIAASLPAGVAYFLFFSFFMGVAEYVSVFVAQYTGAKLDDRVGAALWQGIYFSLVASLLISCLYFFSESIFAFAGHPAKIQELEVTYFNYLLAGSSFAILSVVLSSFYSGRGMTWPVAAVNTIGAAINIPLDYALINGKWGLPEMGIAGAGLATAIGTASIVLLFALILFTEKNDRRFCVKSAWRFEGALFRKFLSYGLPGGVHFFLDIFGFTLFIFIVGRIGRIELATTNIVFSIELLAFLPLMGLSMAASVLAGQAIGAENPKLAKRSVMSAAQISLLCMAFASLAFIFIPEPMISLFRTNGLPSEEFNKVVSMGSDLLKLVAIYSIINAPVLALTGGLKGAGDIRFVMTMITLCSLTFLVLPTYVMVEYLESGILGPWINVIVYVSVLLVISSLRFSSDKWTVHRIVDGPQPVVK